LKINAPAIAGVLLNPLKQIEDERGAVLHMLRCDAPFFTRFGEVYFSVVLPQMVKAWKRHKSMTQHFAVPVGKIKLVLFDDRPLSSSHGQIEKHILGRPDHYYLLRLPPLVWYGFQGLGPEPALLANCADLPHDPNEVETLPDSTPYVPFKWEEDHG
jgi:dTDP-4-dehydrorhamnose 3,5-epimerase